MTGVTVIGLGNLYRGDDAAGLEVARRVREAAPPGVEVMEHEGEPAGLIEVWDGTDLAFVVDAVRGVERPGSIHRLDAGSDGLPESPRRDTSHAFALGEAVALGRALDRLPRRMVVIGIEGESFDPGRGLSPAVAEAVASVTGEILAEVER